MFTSVACHKNLATTHTLNTRAVDEPLRKNRASRQHHLWIGSPLICQTSDTKESPNRSNSAKALEMHFFPTRCKLFTCSCRRNLSCQHQMLEGFSRSGRQPKRPWKPVCVPFGHFNSLGTILHSYIIYIYIYCRTFSRAETFRHFWVRGLTTSCARVMVKEILISLARPSKATTSQASLGFAGNGDANVWLKMDKNQCEIQSKMIKVKNDQR